MKQLVFSAVVLWLLAINCKKSGDSTLSDPQPVDLRIINATSWKFYSCTVDPQGSLSDSPGQLAYNYGEIEPADTSTYHTFGSLYRYAWVKLTMNNKVYYLKPYDYFGETLLAKGRYTYQLTYSSMEDRLNLELIVD